MRVSNKLRPFNKPANVLTESIYSLLIRFSIPNAVGSISLLVIGFADAFYVSRLSLTHLTAFAFCLPLMLFFQMIGFGLMIGTSSTSSRLLGKKHNHLIAYTNTNTLILCFLLTLIACFIFYNLKTPLFLILGATVDLFYLMFPFFNWFLITIPIQVLIMNAFAMMRANGEATKPNLFLLISAFGHCLLCPIFIFGLFGAPRLELLGLIVSRCLFQAFFLVLSLLYLKQKKLLGAIKARLILWKITATELSYIALPAMLAQFFFPLGTGAITRLLSGYSHEAVAAQALGIQVAGIALLIAIAFMNALMPIVGQNWGAKNYSRVIETVKKSYLLCTSTCLIIVFCLMVFSPYIASFLTPEPQVQTLLISFIVLVGIGLPARSISLISSGCLNAIGKPGLAFLINSSRLFFLKVPFAIFLGLFYGVPGIFFGISLGNIILGIASIFLTLYVIKKTV